MRLFTRPVRKGVALALFSSLFAAVSAVRADSLYVANLSSNSVEAYNSGGVRSVFNSTNLSQPVGLAFDSAGNLYVANNVGDSIEELSPSGVALGNIFLGAGSGPTGLAFDSAGNLYVAENSANRIDKISFSGGSPTVSTVLDHNSDGFLSSPVGLAFDSSGFLYVADSGADHIERITSGGFSIFAQNTPTTSTDPLDQPFGLAMDKSGNLFVTSVGNNSIEKINTVSGIMSVFASNLDVPTGIAFDSNGNLFVANAGQNIDPKNNMINTIQEFAVGSTTPTTFATVNDSDHRRLIAFGPDFVPAAVPVPSAAWAAVPLLTLIGLSQLRRRPQ